MFRGVQASQRIRANPPYKNKKNHHAPWNTAEQSDPNRLDGRLTVYAMLDIDPSDLLSMKHPIASMVNNGPAGCPGQLREQNT